MVKIFSRSELFTLPQPEYLVNKVIPQSGLITLVSEPGSKKSFVAVHIACCIATGLNFFDKSVKRGQVIYLAAEGAAGLNKRIQAWEDEHCVRVSDERFALIGSAVAINESGEFKELVSALKAREEQYGAINLIVVDTVNRTLSGDENKALDMSTYVRNCTLLVEEFGVSVLLIHHPSKTSRGARGHSALQGAIDQGLEIVNGTKDVFTLKLDAKPPKNDEPAKDMRLCVKHKDLSSVYGFDDAGEPITSLVLDQTDGSLQKIYSESKQPNLREQLYEPIKQALSGNTLSRQQIHAWLKLNGILFHTKNADRACDDLLARGELIKPGRGLYALAEAEIDTEELTGCPIV